LNWTERLARIREELKQLKTGQRELRRFGLLVGGIFAALGLLLLLRGKAHFPYFLAPGAVLVAFGVAFPRALKHVYLAWMSLAIVLGFIVSNLLLTLFFFLIITPIGLVARLCGKDFLSLKLNRQAHSYWIPRSHKAPKPPAEYEQQF